MTTYYTATGAPAAATRGLSASVRSEFQLVQTAFANLVAGANLTGTPTAPTAATGTSTTQIATTAFVAQEAFLTALPEQTGNSGKVVTTDGTTASWADVTSKMVRVARTSNTILAAADRGKFFDVTSGTFVQTMTASATLGDGWWCVYRNSGSGSAVITPNGAETIDGATALTVFTGQTVLINCDGSNLRSIAICGQRIMVVRDEKADTTAGGSFTSGSYVTRVLNTAATNTINGASLASNQITLPAGKYRVRASAPASKCDLHKAVLYNVTGAAVLLVGTTEMNSSATNFVTRSIVAGTFTLAAQSAIELRHRCQTTSNTIGLGQPASFGDVEVYSEVTIERID